MEEHNELNKRQMEQNLKSYTRKVQRYNILKRRNTPPERLIILKSQIEKMEAYISRKTKYKAS